MESKPEVGVVIPLSVIYNLLLEMKNEVRDLNHKIDSQTVPCATDKGCPTVQKESAGVKGHIKALWFMVTTLIIGLVGLGWKGLSK